MSSYFSGASVPSSIKKELEARSKTNANSKWFASRTVWVQIQSMCSSCWPAYSPLSGLLKSSYSDGTSFGGSRPNPVITAVTVTAQGNLGITRQCSITILAFNKDQLNRIVECYCIPQMSIRVEFGWNQSADGSPSPGPINKEAKTSDNLVVCEINRQRRDHTSYDGLQGRVGKYAITYNESMQAWEIKIDLMATSSPVLSKPMLDTSRSCECTVLQQAPANSGEEPKLVTKNISYLQTTIHSLIKYATDNEPKKLATLVNSIKVPDGKGSYKGGAGYIIEINTRERDELGNAPTGMWADVVDWFSRGPSSRECYISLATFLRILETRSLTQEDGKENSIYATFDLTKSSKASMKAISSNPLICLLPGTTGLMLDLSNKPSVFAGGPGIELGNVLVNAIFINKCINDCGTGASLEDLLGKILSGINEAVGNLWELSIVDLGEGTCGDKDNPAVPTLAIVDLNKVKSGRDVFNMQIGPNAALVRNISLSLKLSSAMQAQALYADVKSDRGESTCDDVRFQRELENNKNLAAPRPKDVGKVETNCADCKKQSAETEETAQDALNKSLVEMYDDINDTTTQSVYTNLLRYYQGKPSKETCKEVIVPYELSLTFDGIGGFAFGQWITTDTLPDKQFNTYDYQITSVEQDLVDGDWTTKVKAIARYKESA